MQSLPMPSGFSKKISSITREVDEEILKNFAMITI